MSHAIKNALLKPLHAVGLDLVRYREKPIRRPESDNKRNLEVGKWDKVFGIGFNKTGSTTLEEIFRVYGLSLPDQSEQETLLTENVSNGNYRDLKNFVDRYDAFQDLPFSQGLTYVVCDYIYPNAKFILTIRNDEEWFSSIYNFHKKIWNFKDRRELNESFFKGRNLYLYPDYVFEIVRNMITIEKDGEAIEDWNLVYDAEHYKKIYRERNNQIIRYFKDRPNKLLTIDLTKEKDTKKICSFLGFPESMVIPTPHLNKT